MSRPAPGSYATLAAALHAALAHPAPPWVPPAAVEHLRQALALMQDAARPIVARGPWRGPEGAAAVLGAGKGGGTLGRWLRGWLAP